MKTRHLEDSGQAYICKTCRTRFSVAETETAVCCPICRMNRIKQVE